MKYMSDLIEPTDDELRNGWTAKTLTAYHAEREQARAAVISDRPPLKPRMAKSKYRPLRWRG